MPWPISPAPATNTRRRSPSCSVAPATPSGWDQRRRRQQEHEPDGRRDGTDQEDAGVTRPAATNPRIAGATPNARSRNAARRPDDGPALHLVDTRDTASVSRPGMRNATPPAKTAVPIRRRRPSATRPRIASPTRRPPAQPEGRAPARPDRAASRRRCAAMTTMSARWRAAGPPIHADARMRGAAGRRGNRPSPTCRRGSGCPGRWPAGWMSRMRGGRHAPGAARSATSRARAAQ